MNDSVSLWITYGAASPLPTVLPWYGGTDVEPLSGSSSRKRKSVPVRSKAVAQLNVALTRETAPERIIH